MIIIFLPCKILFLSIFKKEISEMSSSYTSKVTDFKDHNLSFEELEIIISFMNEPEIIFKCFAADLEFEKEMNEINKFK